MRGRYQVNAAVAVLLLSGAALAAGQLSADGATVLTNRVVSTRGAGMARLVDDVRYPSPGTLVDLEAKRVYCEGQLVLQVRTDTGWQVLKSEPTSGCPDVANKTGVVGTIYGLKVRSPRAPAARDRYRVVSTATGLPRRVSDTLVIRSVGATLSGRVTKRANGDGIDLIRDFPSILVVPWLKTPHGWRQRTGVGYVKSKGGFRLPDLQPGRYKLQVQVSRNGTGLAEQWFGGSNASSAARVVHLSAAAVRRHVDVSLPRGRDVWFAVAGPAPGCVSFGLYPRGETLPYLEAGGPQPDYQVVEIPGLPLTSYKLKLRTCSPTTATGHHWVPTWYTRARSRRAATPFDINESTKSSRRHPLLKVQMLHQ